MSIANIICQGSAGYLLADRGYFHSDGRLAFTARKVLELPRYRAAILARGHLRPRDQIARAVRKAAPATVIDLIAALPNILSDAMMREARVSPLETEATLSTHLSVVYIHPDTNRATGAIIGTDRNGMPDWYDPYSVLQVSEATSPGASLPAILGRDADATDPATFDVRTDGVTLMEGQRRDVWAFNGLPAGHHAAGGIDLTTVTAAGISTIGLRRWRDRVGHRVKLNMEEV